MTWVAMIDGAFIGFCLGNIFQIWVRGSSSPKDSLGRPFGEYDPAGDKIVDLDGNEVAVIAKSGPKRGVDVD